MLDAVSEIEKGKLIIFIAYDTLGMPTVTVGFSAKGVFSSGAFP